MYCSSISQKRRIPELLIINSWHSQRKTDPKKGKSVTDLIFFTIEHLHVPRKPGVAMLQLCVYSILPADNRCWLIFLVFLVVASW